MRPSVRAGRRRTMASADQVPRLKIVDDAAFLHDDDAVGKAHDFRQLRTDQDDRKPLLRQFADEVMHRGL